MCHCKERKGSEKWASSGGPEGGGEDGEEGGGWVGGWVCGGGERGEGGLPVELWPRVAAMDHPNCAFGILWGQFFCEPPTSRRGTRERFPGQGGQGRGGPGEGVRGDVRGALWTKESDSLIAEAHREFLSEPTHKEGEVEDQEDEVEDERDCEECKVESRREVRHTSA